MKITLIEPPSNYKGMFESLWAAYLAAMVDKNDEVNFVDLNMPSASVTSLLKNLKENKPDLIGLTTWYGLFSNLGYSLDPVKKIAAEFKKINPDGKVMIGGYNASFGYQNLLKEPNYDFAIVGEGELTFRDLVKRLDNDKDLDGIKGLAYKKNGKTQFNGLREPIKDLDSLPFPDRSIFPKEFRKSSNVTARIVSARGCYYGKCSFCSISAFYGGPHYAFRSPENIADELEQILEFYENPFITFIDEAILARLDKIIEEKHKRGLEFNFSINARADMINKYKKNIKLGKENGLDFIGVGIENFSNRILKTFRKGVTAEDNIKALDSVFETGVQPKIEFIMFSPWIRKEEIWYNMRLLLKYELYKQELLFTTNLLEFWNSLWILPGTELYEKYGTAPKFADSDVKNALEVISKNAELLDNLNKTASNALAESDNSKLYTKCVHALCQLIILGLRKESTTKLENSIKNIAMQNSIKGNSNDFVVISKKDTPIVYNLKSHSYDIINKQNLKDLDTALAYKFVQQELADGRKPEGYANIPESSEDILLNIGENTISKLSDAESIAAQYLLLGLNDNEIEKQLEFEKIDKTVLASAKKILEKQNWITPN